MRLYLKLTASKALLPFNYQHLLAGAIHKWMGRDNQWHGGPSLYSFSWLQGMAPAGKQGLKTGVNPFFFISAHDDHLIRTIVAGILKSPEVFEDLQVSDVQIADAPHFSTQERFALASPVFVKKYLEKGQQHLTYEDEEANALLTKSLQSKLAIAGLPNEGVAVQFDTSYPNPRIKTIAYRDIKNKVSLCPVIISGSPEQVRFAWKSGIGNSTGIGFGALK